MFTWNKDLFTSDNNMLSVESMQRNHKSFRVLSLFCVYYKHSSITRCIPLCLIMEITFCS